MLKRFRPRVQIETSLWTNNNRTTAQLDRLVLTETHTLNRVEYVEVSHAGSQAIGGQVGSIVLDGFPGGTLAVVNTTVENGLGNGLIEFASNTFGGLSEAPVRIVPDEVAKLDSSSTFLPSNADNRVAIDEFGSVTADAVWPDPGVPYAVVDELVVGAALTLSPGIEMQFDDSVRLRVNRDGAIIADASGGQAIRFVGSTPLPGWWRGIQIDSDDTANIMDNVEIRHAGEASLSREKEMIYRHRIWIMRSCRAIGRRHCSARCGLVGVGYYTETGLVGIL